MIKSQMCEFKIILINNSRVLNKYIFLLYFSFQSKVHTDFFDIVFYNVYTLLWTSFYLIINYDEICSTQAPIIYTGDLETQFSFVTNKAIGLIEYIILFAPSCNIVII